MQKRKRVLLIMHAAFSLSWTDKYEGTWEEDQRTGHGVYYWIDGQVYIGEFVNGERTGYGVMHFTDSSIYEGQFKQGLREGMVKNTL